MTAEEMFKGLDYKKEIKDDYIIFSPTYSLIKMDIIFDVANKEINFNYDEEFCEFDINICIEYSLIKAIRKQIEELGW